MSLSLSLRNLVVALLLIVGNVAAAEDVFVVKPYLQIGKDPSATSLQLLWHAPEAAGDWSVELRPGTDSPWRKTGAPLSRKVAVTGIAPHRVFNASLTGLKSGEPFQYRVLKGTEVVFSAEARGPKSANQSIR